MARRPLLPRDAFAPLARLAQWTETVDLQRPGQRLQVGRADEIGSVVATFNRCSTGSKRNARRAASACSPLKVELAIYRIGEERLTNIARHAQARRVVVALEPSRGSVVLRVADGGRGFAGAPTEHGGLRSMRERAVLVDGALEIKPAPEGGVEVRLVVPTAERVAAGATS